MRSSARRAGPALLVGGSLVLLGALALAAQEEPPPEAEGAGTAEGYLEVARQRTELHYAYVRGESGDGASDRLSVVLSDRELDAEAVADASTRDAMAHGGQLVALTAMLDDSGAVTEVLLHHPRLPAALSLRGLAKFVREGAGTDRLEGRLVLGGEGTTFSAWFGAPIVREPAGGGGGGSEAARGTEDDDGQASDAEGDEEGVQRPATLAAAVEAGDARGIRRLLSLGAQPDERADRAALTPLMVAAGGDCLDCTTALLEGGANVKTRTSSGYSALMAAVAAGKAEQVRALLAAGADAKRDAATLLTICDEKGLAEIRDLVRKAAEAPAGGG